MVLSCKFGDFSENLGDYESLHILISEAVLPTLSMAS